MRIQLHSLALLIVLGACASGPQTSRTEDEAARLRRMTRGGTGQQAALAVDGTLYLIPSGVLVEERSTLLGHVVAAGPIRAANSVFPHEGTAENSYASSHSAALLRAIEKGPPPADRSIHAWSGPATIEIAYSDSTLRLRRWDLGSTGYFYEIESSSDEAGSVGIHSTPELDGAWNDLVHAARKRAFYRHLDMSIGAGEVSTGSPLESARSRLARDHD